MEDETRRATALENASLILPSISGGAELWLGNRRVGESPELLQCLGVSSIVNCAAVQVTPSTDPSIDTLCLALHDGLQVDASSGNVSVSDGVGAKQFEAAAAFIASALADGRTVLVHCADGVSRSAAITIAFLLIRGDTLRSAFRRVLAARPVVAPNGGLVNALIDYEAVEMRCGWCRDDRVIAAGRERAVGSRVEASHVTVPPVQRVVALARELRDVHRGQA